MQAKHCVTIGSNDFHLPVGANAVGELCCMVINIQHSGIEVIGLEAVDVNVNVTPREGRILLIVFV